ncbi:MAG: hypothetical protein KDA88_00295 [Planctomycetaceae bacterium]|nr:hypothetical protein [Planctomycetaceae bacterium]MCA9032914.1 hypothetical protein [Planctomycetaceae bacterium]MCB9950294.1 hypothetical protein [Planctomycetaceae bacterium]
MSSRNWLLHCFMSVGLLLATGWAVLSTAADPMKEGPVEDRAVTPEREAAAMTFAKRHHPELASLVETLKKRDAAGYESAVRELFRTSERLAKLQPRFPDRYSSELEIWKLDSRIRLMAAQSVSGMPEAQRAEMKKLLLLRQEIRLAQVVAERKKLAQRLEKLDESISQLQQQSDELAEKEMDRLLRSVNVQVKKPKPQ